MRGPADAQTRCPMPTRSKQQERRIVKLGSPPIDKPVAKVQPTAARREFNPPRLGLNAALG